MGSGGSGNKSTANRNRANQRPNKPADHPNATSKPKTPRQPDRNIDRSDANEVLRAIRFLRSKRERTELNQNRNGIFQIRDIKKALKDSGKYMGDEKFNKAVINLVETNSKRIAVHKYDYPGDVDASIASRFVPIDTKRSFRSMGQKSSLGDDYHTEFIQHISIRRK
jgi:hypothetical protein